MRIWWESLTLLQRVFACIAIPSTLLLILQLVMTLIGLGDHEGDLDGDHASFTESLGSLRLFTFRGILAFLAVWGWAVLAITRAGRPWLMGVLLGLVLGAAAMVLIALTMQMILRLQADGTVSLPNAVGSGGEVYLSVPALRSGEGKVNVVIQDTMTECAAVTDETSPSPTGTPVTVVGVTKERQLIVMRR